MRFLVPQINYVFPDMKSHRSDVKGQHDGQTDYARHIKGIRW